ncbi:MAG: hypothetical protein HQ514_14640 [Rhodospirillales bacterium]|nr:hypothetical protein [Rhodospirillales bacterium]
MSETTTKTSSSAKDSAKKSTNDSTSAAKESTAKDSTASASSDDGAKAKPSGDDAPAAAPAASNGKSDVYYGKFSNVKNPAYRGGWDDIWGNGEPREKAPAQKMPARKKAAPVTLMLDMADMPKALRASLADFARAELKRQKSRLNYDKRDKAGSVNWRIECRIES